MVGWVTQEVTRYGSVSVCPSVCHKPVLYRNDWTDRAGFGAEASFHLSHTVFYGNSGNSKNKGISLLNFAPELWTLKISAQQVDRVVNKTRRRYVGR